MNRYPRFTVSLAAILLAAAIGIIVSTARVEAQGVPSSNTALDVIDADALSKIRIVAVVGGMSATFNRKTKSTSLGVIEPTTKLVTQLVIALRERAGSNAQVAGDGSGSVDLVDPFDLDKSKSKALGRIKRIPLTWTDRAWQECGNCSAAAEAQQADALWVVWGRWFSNEPPEKATKVHYTDEKGWLHGSAYLFDVSGKLIAITSMNRTGVGALGMFNAGPAYKAIGRAMVKSFLQHRGAAQDSTKEE